MDNICKIKSLLLYCITCTNGVCKISYKSDPYKTSYMLENFGNLKWSFLDFPKIGLTWLFH